MPLENERSLVIDGFFPSFFQERAATMSRTEESRSSRSSARPNGKLVGEGGNSVSACLFEIESRLVEIDHVRDKFSLMTCRYFQGRRRATHVSYIALERTMRFVSISPCVIFYFPYLTDEIFETICIYRYSSLIKKEIAVVGNLLRRQGGKKNKFAR